MEKIITSSTQDQAPIFDLLSRAQIAFERCDFSLARRYYSQALKNPNASYEVKLRAQYGMIRCDLEDCKPVPIDEHLAELASDDSDFSLYFQSVLCVLSQRPKDSRKIALKLYRQTSHPELKEKALIIYADSLAQIGRYRWALAFFSKVSEVLPEIRFSKQISIGRLHFMLGDPQKSEKILLDVIHELYGTDYWYYISRAQLYYANILRNLRKKEQALAVLNMLPENSTRISKTIHTKYLYEKTALHNDVDIILDTGKRTVVMKDRQEISLGNQNILIKMLKLFMMNPKKKFSKEELIHQVWEERYDPSIHDNKIYYSINRLRKLLGHSKDNKIIVSHGLSYGLNSNIKVEIL